MATTDQEQRVASAWCDFELRFFLGADRLLTDMSLLEIGASYDPDVSTALDGAVNIDSTSITVDSTTGFDRGFIVVHPGGTGEQYELIAYGSKTSTTFDDLTRFGVTPDAMAHSDNSVVSEWMEITDLLIDGLTITMSQGDEIGDWSAAISGYGYDSTLFQPNRSILAMVRYRPSAGVLANWTSWGIFFIGFLQDITVTGTASEDNPWTATVQSLAYYLGLIEIGSGQTYGRTDLAEGKNVEVSSYLQRVYEEEDSHEFVGLPTVNGDKIVDSDLGTLWISEGEPAPTEETPVASAGVFNEVFLRSEPWMPDDLQWFEIHFRSSQEQDPRGFGQCDIASSATTWRQINWDPVAWIPLNNYLNMPDTPPPAVGEDYFCVLTNNRAQFLAYFPQCTVDVFDWRALEVGTFTLDPTGDFLCGRFLGTRTWDVVWWDGGRAGWALYDFVTAGSYYYSLPGTNYSGWTGSMITVPPVGHSFRREPTGNKTWPGTTTPFVQDEDHPTPGSYITGSPEWAIVDLGAIGISLSAELSSTETTSASFGESGTLGLVDGPAYVVIDTEIIGYTSIDRINAQILGLSRGQFSTTPATHPAGSLVYQYEEGAQTGNHLVNTFTWRRKPLWSAAYSRWICPRHFDLYVTPYETGYPTPTEAEWDDGLGSGGWEDYWDRVASVRYYNSTYWQSTILEALRARKVMIAIMFMGDTGRVKLNEFGVFGPIGLVASGGIEQAAFEAGLSTAILIHLLTTWLSVPEDNISALCDGLPMGTTDVTSGSLSGALKDICESSLTTIRFMLDNTVEIDWDAMAPINAWPDVEFYWTRTNTRTVRLNRTMRTAVAQVKVKITNPVTDEVFEAAYPSDAMPLGDVLVREKQLVISSVDEATLIAETEYRKENYAGNTVTIVPVGIAEFAYPGQRHVVTYDVDSADVYLSGHNVVIIDVKHTISFGDEVGEGKGWDTEIVGRRVEYA